MIFDGWMGIVNTYLTVLMHYVSLKSLFFT